MSANTISVPYQVVYIVLPTISVLGNTLIIYATLISRELRNPCNIFIALVALGDIMLMFSFYTTIVTYKLYEDHLIPQDVCVYFNIIPFFGTCFSTMLLLNLALDRLLSLTTLYNLLSSTYAKLYIMVHVLPGCAFGITVDVLMILNRAAGKNVLCTMSTLLLPPVAEIFVKTTFIICVSIILCYSFFALFLRRLKMSTEVTKNVYRSLIVISLTVVFGTFGCVIVAMTDDPSDTENSSMLAGILISSGTAVNFFAYYSMSTQYRGVFDSVFGIGRLKNAVFPKKPTTVFNIAPRTLEP
ncbi:hypothetical protein V3C99_009056 [Haemonchus contortus]